MNGAEEATLGGVFAALVAHFVNDHRGDAFCPTDAPGTALRDNVALMKTSSTGGIVPGD